MAGRAFRGASARITFSTEGSRAVLNTLGQIDRYFKKLSTDADRFARLQERINNLQNRIQSKQGQYGSFQASAVLQLEKSQQRILDLRGRIADATMKHNNMLMRQNTAELNSANRIAMVKDQLAKREATARTNVAKLLTVNEDAARRILGHEENVIKKRMQIRKELRGYVKELSQATGINGRMLTDYRSIGQALQNWSSIEKSLRAQHMGRDRIQLLHTHLKQLDNMYKTTDKLGDQQQKLSAERRAQITREAADLNGLKNRLVQLGIQHTALQDININNAKASVNAIDRQKAALNLLIKSDKNMSDEQKRVAANYVNQLGMMQKSLTGLLAQEKSFTKSVATGWQALAEKIANNRDLLKKFAGAAGAAAGAFALIKFGQFIAASFNLAVAVERVEASMRALVGSAEVARNIVDDMFRMSTRIPVAPTQLLEGARTMLSVGTPVKDLNRDIRALSVLATAANQNLSELSVIYGEIRNKDRVYREDILQFSRRGIPLMQQLQEALGVTREDLNQMVSDGIIKFDVFQAALRRLTEETGRFAEMPAEIMETTSGKMQKLSNSVTSMMRSVGDLFAEVASPALFEFFEGLTEVIDEDIKVIRAWRAEMKAAQAAAQIAFGLPAGGKDQRADALEKQAMGMTDDQLTQKIKTTEAGIAALQALVESGNAGGDTVAILQARQEILRSLKEEVELRKIAADQGMNVLDAEGRRVVDMVNHNGRAKDAIDDLAAARQNNIILTDAERKAVENLGDELLSEKEKLEKSIGEVERYVQSSIQELEALAKAGTMPFDEADQKITQLQQSLPQLIQVLRDKFADPLEKEIIELENELMKLQGVMDDISIKSKEFLGMGMDPQKVKEWQDLARAKEKRDKEDELAEEAKNIKKQVNEQFAFVEEFKRLNVLLDKKLLTEAEMAQYLADTLQIAKSDPFSSTTMGIENLHSALQDAVLSKDAEVVDAILAVKKVLETVANNGMEALENAVKEMIDKFRARAG